MNKVGLIGRPTRDPEIRHAQTKNNEQMLVARYTLAVDRRTKEGGADFISCVAFGKQAEFVEKYIKMGTKIGVTGRLQTGSYTNKDGQKVFTTDVVVEEHDFCEKKDAQPEPAETPNDFMDIPEGIENNLPFK